MKKYLLFFSIVIMGTMIAGQSNAQSESSPDSSTVKNKSTVENRPSWGNPATDPWNQPGIIQNENDVTESYSYKSYGSGSDVIVVTKYWIHESDTINTEKRVLRMEDVFRTYVDVSVNEYPRTTRSMLNTTKPVRPPSNHLKSLTRTGSSKK